MVDDRGGWTVQHVNKQGEGPRGDKREYIFCTCEVAKHREDFYLVVKCGWKEGQSKTTPTCRAAGAEGLRNSTQYVSAPNCKIVS